MLDTNQIKGLIFDYGATIDSNGKHWAEVLWDAYQNCDVPVSKEAFRDAYVYGERYLALHPIIGPEFTFKDVLLAKTQLQINWLISNGFLTEDENSSHYFIAISEQCYTFVVAVIEKARPILEKLSLKYPMVLVSNFYGNIQTILKEFGLDSYFKEVVESAVVGVRKPDPAIFSMGVKALGLQAEETVVVGDSYKKDIVPAQSIGCQTIWLKGPGWEADQPDATADLIITDFIELKTAFNLS